MSRIVLLADKQDGTLLMRPETHERGSAMVEFVVSFPLLFFSLLAAVAVGMYCYCLISVQDASRMVALYASSSLGNGNTSAACQYLLSNLSKLPKVSSATTCSGGTSPVTLTLTSVTGPDGNSAVQVTVAYQTINVVPIYGLPGHLTITRTVEARRRS
jgi:Flp pilus assembly protein TadG